MEAKAGDTITEKARKRLQMCLGGNYPLDQIPTKVEAKSAGEQGQWFCITCGGLPRNNMEASTHAREPKHKLAWRNFDSGKIEAPSDAADDSNEVKVGDLREGIGGMHVRVRVDSISADGKKAECTLVRLSGRQKTISVATLKKAYKLIYSDTATRHAQERRAADKAAKS